LLRSARILVLVLLALVITTLNRDFATMSNLLNILRWGSAATILAAGLTLVAITGGIDLSVGSVLSLSACVAAYLMTQTAIGWPLAVAGALAASACVGVVNGILVTFAGLPPFVATYGMLWVAAGLAGLLMRGSVYYGFPKGFLFLGAGHLLGVPLPVFLMGILVVVLTFLLQKTTYGRELYVIGSNIRAARLAGIKIDKARIIAYCISSICAGMAGLLYIARLNAADSATGELMLRPAIAAVTVGGTSLLGGLGSVTGTVTGSFIMTVVLAGMNILNISSFLQPTVTGGILIGTVIADVAMRRRETMEEDVFSLFQNLAGKGSVESKKGG
jgi:ribose transport system permease protein